MTEIFRGIAKDKSDVINYILNNIEEIRESAKREEREYRFNLQITDAGLKTGMIDLDLNDRGIWVEDMSLSKVRAELEKKTRSEILAWPAYDLGKAILLMADSQYDWETEGVPTITIPSAFPNSGECPKPRPKRSPELQSYLEKAEDRFHESPLKLAKLERFVSMARKVTEPEYQESLGYTVRDDKGILALTFAGQGETGGKLTFRGFHYSGQVKLEGWGAAPLEKYKHIIPELFEAHGFKRQS